MPDASYDLVPEEPEKRPDPVRPATPRTTPPERPAAAVRPSAARPSAPTPPPPSPSMPSAPPAEQVPDISERHCPSCGFKIVGKKIKRCPECSAALDAAATDLLQFSGNLWIRWISWGPIIMALAVFLHVGGTILAWKIQPLAGQFINMLGAVALATGTWIASAPEVGGPPQRRALWALVARGLTILTVLLWWGALIFLMVKHAAPPVWLITTILITMAGEACALALFLQGLAQRVPSDSLSVQLQNLMWLMPVSLAVVLVAQFIDLKEFIPSAFYCTFPMMGGLAGIMVWAAITFLRLSLELRNVVAASESIITRRLAREAKQAKK